MGGVAFGATTTYTVAQARGWTTYFSDNTSGTYATTTVATTDINPDKHVILGWQLIDIDLTVNEQVVSLRLADSWDTLIDEDEVANGADRENPWFSFPRTISHQLKIFQSNGTRVLIYYTTK